MEDGDVDEIVAVVVVVDDGCCEVVAQNPSLHVPS